MFIWVVVSGCEAIEMAVKLGRNWGYRVKGITPGMAKVVFAENNSSGNSITAVSVSSNPALSEEFGPCAPGMEVVPFNNPDYLNVSDARCMSRVPLLTHIFIGKAERPERVRVRRRTDPV